MPIVYVVNEPVKRDPETGQMKRIYDLIPAEGFGSLVYLLPPGDVPGDSKRIIDMLWDGLARFKPTDYLLPIGHPLYIAWAATVAAQKAGGTLTMLLWDNKYRCYRPVHAVLWTLEPENQHERESTCC
jgi:hypothetical protein